MAEISYNPDVESVIRGNLAATREWGWAEDDRKWAAIGAALKYLHDHTTMSEMLALGLAEKITTEIMSEESESKHMEATRQAAEEYQEDEEEDEEIEGDGSGLHQCPYCYDVVNAEHEEFCRLNPNRNREIVP